MQVILSYCDGCALITSHQDQSRKVSMNNKQYDVANYEVLVVGGGMVGAALAAALGHKGFQVAVVEQQQPAPFVAGSVPDVRVSALTLASETLLRSVGAWASMQAMRMCPYRRMAVWEKTGFSLTKADQSRLNQTLFDSKKSGHEQLGFIVENRVTQLGLLESLQALPNVKMFCPAKIKKMDFSGKQPEITLQNGTRLSAELVVGADGAQSNVREQAGIRLDVSEYEQQCLVATVEIAGPQQDITWQAFTPTGPESFLPLPEVNGTQYASIVWYHQPEQVRRLIALSDQAFIKELMRTFPSELPEINALHQRGSFPLARRHANTYFKPGVVLVGDAAHTINPLAGQGVNLGFQDVAWLTQHLLNAKQRGLNLGSVDVLAGYEKARRKENQLMMTTMDAFYHTFSNNHLPVKLIRNALLTVAGKSGPALKQVMKYAMGASGKQPEWLSADDG